MATNTKDNLQAHRFMNRRVRAALLEGDAESNTRPLARIGTGTYAGIFVTIALLAVVGIIGVLKPGGSTAWQRTRGVHRRGGDRRPLRLSRRGAAPGAELLVGKAAARRPVARGHRVGPVAGVGTARRRDRDPDGAGFAAGRRAHRRHRLVGVRDRQRRGRATSCAPRCSRGRPLPATRSGTDDGYLVRTTSGRTYPDLVRSCLRDRRAVAGSVEVQGRRRAAGR